jgi:hypothetical protein
MVGVTPRDVPSLVMPRCTAFCTIGMGFSPRRKGDMMKRVEQEVTPELQDLLTLPTEDQMDDVLNSDRRPTVRGGNEGTSRSRSTTRTQTTKTGLVKPRQRAETATPSPKRRRRDPELRDPEPYPDQYQIDPFKGTVNEDPENLHTHDVMEAMVEDQDLGDEEFLDQIDITGHASDWAIMDQTYTEASSDSEEKPIAETEVAVESTPEPAKSPAVDFAQLCLEKDRGPNQQSYYEYRREAREAVLDGSNPEMQRYWHP